MMFILAAATTQKQPGWGGPIALLVAGLVFWLGVTLYRRWENTKSGSFSSAEAPRALDAVKAQVSADSVSADSGSAEVVPIRAKKIEQALQKHADKPRTAAVKEAAKEARVSERAVWRHLEARKSGGAA